MANKKIKVSEATVAKLRKGTMAGNLAKAKGASPEMREALTRFYGSKRVTAAIGKTGPGSMTKPKPFTPKPNDREGRKPAVITPRGGPGAKMAGTKPKASAAKTNTVVGGKRVDKPIINLPKMAGSAQSKMTAQAKANAALLAKQKKAAQAKRDGMKY